MPESKSCIDFKDQRSSPPHRPRRVYERSSNPEVAAFNDLERPLARRDLRSLINSSRFSFAFRAA